MTLSEKILYCRRKSGLSQEALSERLGVSRQAVSKWETGDATPEVGKLKALADAFCVTTDWLLSEDEPKSEAAPEPPETKIGAERTWVDALPGFIGKTIRRYGWLYGVYMALAGLPFIVFGTLSHVRARQMLAMFDDVDLSRDPMMLFGTAVIAIGVVLVVAGAALAVGLKRWGKKGG